MTNPSVTYGHGVLEELAVALSTKSDSADPLTTPSCTSLYGDVIKISGTCDSSADEYVAYRPDDYIADSISTTLYPYAMARWKTSESSNGLGARIRLDYNEGGSDEILGTSTPQFSTEWTVSIATLTAAKTLKWLWFYADDYPDSIDSGTYHVYYEFFLLYKGTFTFPNVGHGLEYTPPPRYAIIPIPSRVGDITQGLGSELATVRASCDLDIGTWKRLVANGYSADDYVDGQVFDEISHRTYAEPWQWLNTGTGRQFKATLETPVFRYMPSGNKTQHILDLLFREYRLSDASNESYVERFGLNL